MLSFCRNINPTAFLPAKTSAQGKDQTHAKSDVASHEAHLRRLALYEYHILGHRLYLTSLGVSVGCNVLLPRLHNNFRPLAVNPNDATLWVTVMSCEDSWYANRETGIRAQLVHQEQT